MTIEQLRRRADKVERSMRAAAIGTDADDDGREIDRAYRTGEWKPHHVRIVRRWYAAEFRTFITGWAASRCRECNAGDASLPWPSSFGYAAEIVSYPPNESLPRDAVAVFETFATDRSRGVDRPAANPIARPDLRA